MTMELNSNNSINPSSSSSSSASASLQLTSYGFFYGVPDHQNAAFYSPLSVMPLKSDGSLCVMESLSRSLPQVTSSTPKLEDFFGGTTMGGSHHHYENNNIGNREAMALSLNSMFYHQPNSQEQDQHQVIKSYYNSKETSDHTMAAANNDHFSSVSVNGNSNNNNSAIMGCGDLKALSLSMSPRSQSSCVTASVQVSNCMLNDCIDEGHHVVVMDTKKRGRSESGSKTAFPRKSLDTFGQRTSQYRGVTRHRWTGRYEAHLWDNSCKKEGQSRKGRQVYLGGYDVEEKAGRAYDLAALKYWGASTHINFPYENYEKELEEMKNMSRQEYVAHLRRKSSGFSRGASIYRGVTRHHQHGRWQARIGRVAGNKDLYLGTFSTQEQAAEAYDIAAIKFRGLKAVTNFDMTRYDAERIMSSNTLLAGELAKRNIHKGPVGPDSIDAYDHTQNTLLAHTINGNMIGIGNVMSDWKTALYPSSEPLSQMQGSNENYQLEAVKQAPHLSNESSSLVTNLSGSREGSAVSSWITCSQQPEMPFFAAWNDA